MPGNLASPAPSGVFPQTLSTAFSETRIFPILESITHDGTSLRSLIVDGVNAPISGRTWKQTKRLKSTDLATLISFIETQEGSLGRWYFYNPFEPSSGQPIGSNYDATGVSTQGRHICMFTLQGWGFSRDIARGTISVEFTSMPSF